MTDSVSIKKFFKESEDWRKAYNRLYNNFKINKENGCWEWTGRLIDGYGHFHFPFLGFNPFYASKASWIIHFGPINNLKLCVCHSCDNKKCVNPDHLWLGTNQDNQIDAREKGIIKIAYNSPHSKLSLDDVKHIRILKQMGITTKLIAEKFNVTKLTVERAAFGRGAWSKITNPPPATHKNLPGRKKNICDLQRLLNDYQRI